MPAIRTYLEMREPSHLRPAAVPDVIPAFALERQAPPALYRRLYLTIGAGYAWTDRAAWTDAETAAHLARPDIDLWIARVSDELAGYFELRRCNDGSVEIAYFGVMPAFQGKGIGGYMLTVAAREAWALQPTRVWLHTSSLDHPSALPNYQKRGFVVTGTEEYEPL